MKRFTLELQTDGADHIVNLSPLIQEHGRDLRGGGVLHVFVVGSTAAITTMEYEVGLVKHDWAEVLERIAPADARYLHEATWNDDNGHSHVRAALVGPGVSIPFQDGRLLTGEYQQVVLMEFDTRPRKRTVICTVIGHD